MRWHGIVGPSYSDLTLSRAYPPPIGTPPKDTQLDPATMTEQETPVTPMSNSRLSRRKAKHLPPRIQSDPSQGAPANPSDPFIFWSSGSPCSRCGDVFVFDASKILRPLQPIPCTSYGKNTNALLLWAMISIAAYFGSLVLLLIFFPETALSPAMNLKAPLGFFGVLGLIVALAAILKSKLQQKVSIRIHSLSAELERRPEDMEILGKVFSLCRWQEQHEHAVRIAEYASQLNPDNAAIRNLIQTYRSTLGMQGLIPTTGHVAHSTPSATPTTLPQTPFFSPADKQIIARIEAWHRQGRSMQNLGIVIVPIALILGFLSMVITFMMSVNALWGWIPALALALWGVRMSRKPITPLPPGVTPPLGYTVPDPQLEK